ncbi:MAG: alpha/beta fold hydrolase [Acidimicrobiales bacterium]
MINVERRGAGPALVLVHGITESHHSFDPLIGSLAESHDVLALDLRGHGESTREGPYDVLRLALDVQETLGAAGVSDVVLVGHSLGGSVVSVAAALMSVRGVVNLDQTMDLTSFQASLRALEPLLRADAATFAATMDMIFDAMRGSLSDEEWARLRALRRYDQDVVLDIWASVFELGEDELAAMVTNLAGSIHAPYLSLHGTDPGENYESWLSALVPQAVVERWAGAGHYPHLAEPERFLARLADFEARL